MKKTKSKNLEMLDFTKKRNQKIQYGAICRKSVIVGFVIKNRRLYFVTRD